MVQDGECSASKGPGSNGSRQAHRSSQASFPGMARRILHVRAFWWFVLVLPFFGVHGCAGILTLGPKWLGSATTTRGLALPTRYGRR